MTPLVQNPTFINDFERIALVNNDRSITYGTSATDTSDGTALDASKVLRVIIPLRPGDVIRVVRAASDVNTDQVILNLGYDENPGMFAARYETVGSNNKFNNIFPRNHLTMINVQRHIAMDGT